MPSIFFLSLRQVPNQRGAVLAGRSQPLAIRTEGERRDLAQVARELPERLEVVSFPNADLAETANGKVFAVRAESQSQELHFRVNVRLVQELAGRGFQDTDRVVGMEQ